MKVWMFTGDHMLGITHLEAQDLLVCAQRTLAGGSKRGALRGELVL